MDKVLFIVGPTAVGKTKLAVNIAKKLNGEIISADSRQVYKHLDIATGKDLQNLQFTIYNLQKNPNLQFLKKSLTVGFYLMDKIKVWGLDIVLPDYQFNVSDYRNYATAVIGDIKSRGKLPIVVGGTGLYIRSLVDPWETMDVPPNLELRNKLLGYSVLELQEELKNVDPKKWEMMNESDQKNQRRLIRAIEVGKSGKKIPVVTGMTNYKIVGLMAPLEFIYQKIDDRVDQRIRDGVEKEKEKLLVMGYSLSLPSMSVTGYKQLPDVEKWKLAEHQYAKKQLVYLKKVKNIQWFDVTDKNFESDILKVC